MGKAENDVFSLSHKVYKTHFYGMFNSLPNDKFLDRSKFKTFAEDKINMTQTFKFDLWWVENIVGKGENAGDQHFLLFPQCFQKASFSRSFKVVLVW